MRREIFPTRPIFQHFWFSHNGTNVEIPALSNFSANTKSLWRNINTNHPLTVSTRHNLFFSHWIRMLASGPLFFYSRVQELWWTLNDEIYSILTAEPSSQNISIGKYKWEHLYYILNVHEINMSIWTYIAVSLIKWQCRNS